MIRDKKVLGNIGEKIVCNRLSRTNENLVIINTDEFGFWDLEHSNKKIQVKTSTPFFKYKCWSFSSGIESILKCDELWIVSMPLKFYCEFNGWVVNIDVKNRLDKSWIFVLPGSEKKSLNIPMHPEIVNKVFKLTGEEESHLLKHSLSYFNK